MKYIAISILVFVMMGCNKSTQKLYLPNPPHVGNIKTKGYFLGDKEKGQLFFLYNNGVFLDFSVSIEDDTLSVEKQRENAILFFSEKENYKRRQYGWGVWHIEGNKIIIEKWTSGSGKSYYPIGRYVGNVVNDSTINIAFTYANPPTGDEEKERFRFREFSPKPDSTNTFIE